MQPLPRRCLAPAVFVAALTVHGGIGAEASGGAPENVPGGGDAHPPRQMEWLDRGVVAVPLESGGVYVGWRWLGTEPDDIAFNLYRVTGDAEPVRLNDEPIRDSTNYVDEAVDLSRPTTYEVRPLLDGQEQRAGGGSYTLPADPPVRPYLPIPIQTPEGYGPNDASAADLDGDGRLDLVLMQLGRSKDNSQQGETDPPILQGYTLDGDLLWEINLGPNIRAGAHYSPFMVYDLDGDGFAEVVVKTSDGTVDGTGRVLGDAEARHANGFGAVLRGPEWLTVFDGRTGAALDTVNYVPARTERNPEDPDPADLKRLWGDDYGNRSDRYLAAVAYLDGQRPSVVMARGYYTRTALTAYDLKGGKLAERWRFDTGPDSSNPYFGQGNHNLSVADVDGDGRDEILYGAMAIDDDGTGLWSTGYGHGDAIHVGDLDPDNPGLEVFDIQEPIGDAGAHMEDARTGRTLWKKPSTVTKGEGPGRGVAFNVDPRYPGSESWTTGGGIEGVWDAKGKRIGWVKPGENKNPDARHGREGWASVNFRIFWDGDLLDELLNDTTISKWDWENEQTRPLLVAEGTRSNNWTKATPALSADLLGDWREELILPAEDHSELRLYTTTIPTTHRLRTLMHDPVYRLGIAWQNVAYNQPPHVGYYIDPAMPEPPRPNIAPVGPGR